MKKPLTFQRLGFQMATVSILGLLATMLLPLQLGAITITFDEFPADNWSQDGIPADRYAAWGVTFTSTDDGSTWDGLSNGDPGNWDLEGTSGPSFSGFNGASYGLMISFSSDIQGFSLDVSRSLGSSSGNTFTLEGYANASLVDAQTVTLGDLNSWSTVSLNGIIDEVKWFGEGAGFHPFGVDNLQWETAIGVPDAGSSGLLLGLACLALAGWGRRPKVHQAVNL